MTFHLAIPSKDLAESMFFYRLIGAEIGRKYLTHFVMNLFGAQVVCHKSLKYARSPEIYPRHFGVVLETRNDLLALWSLHKGCAYVFEEYFIRREGKDEEHHTFFLKDPSNNLIEMKWYKNQSAVF